MTLKPPAPPAEIILERWFLMCTSESPFWRWEFEIEAINLCWSCLTALHPLRAQESIREQAGLMLFHHTRVHPSYTPSGLGRRYTWVVPWEPLLAFKCTHQTIWTSDQILNGVQIMQQRRLLYWREEEYLVVFQGSEAWLRSSHSMKSEFRTK